MNPNCDSIPQHEIFLMDSHLTAKPRGGYVHAMQLGCRHCRETFYLVTNSDDENRPVHDAFAAHGFAAMVKNSLCRSVNHAR